VSYATESQELEATILDVIHAWHKTGHGLADVEFNTLALRVLAHQLRYNIPYAKYCASFGVTEFTLPASWEHIPAVPAAAYKEATLATFNPTHATLTFETSGTTRGIGGKHFMETSALYDAALLAAFDRLVLRNQTRPFRYLNLLPNPADRPQSSLGYMMAKISTKRGDGHTGWYVRDDQLLFEAFVKHLQKAIADKALVFLTGTAFAFVQVCDELAKQRRELILPPSSLVMETGGFKGRSRIVSRDELYTSIAQRLSIRDDQILSEYGMTELTSQWYSDTGGVPRLKVAPPWLRARVIGIGGERRPKGTVGALAHIDLANRSSCVAIQTEDLGAEVDGGIVLVGREQGAALRGCSLDMEELQTR
jgi:hypothetical protein